MAITNDMRYIISGSDDKKLKYGNWQNRRLWKITELKRATYV